MPSSFAQFAIAPSLVERLHQTGKDIPTPVQERAIPALLQGRDVICRAQTGVVYQGHDGTANAHGS